MIAARAISGIGAAFVMPATLSLLTTVFPPHERAKAIAIWAGFAGAGGALGPLIAGFLLTGWWIFPSFWWGAVFVVNIVVSVVVMIAVAVFAPRSKDDSATPLDPFGAVLSLIGVSALLYGIIEGPERGWGDSYVVGAFVVAAAVLLDLRVVGAARPSTRCCRCRTSATAASRPAAGSSRSASS